MIKRCEDASDPIDCMKQIDYRDEAWGTGAYTLNEQLDLKARRVKSKVYNQNYRQRHPDYKEKLWRRQGIVGMTLERYEEMLKEQGGHCYLCPRRPGKSRLAVDHDHTTGRPRRLLCVICNLALERLENHNGWGEKAIAYLKEFAE